jgi:hypothetical protein
VSRNGVCVREIRNSEFPARAQIHINARFYAKEKEKAEL